MNIRTVFYTGNEDQLTVTNVKLLELPVNADIKLSDWFGISPKHQKG